MENISMLELRKNAGRIIRKAQKGERMLLCFRGKPVIRLEPVIDKASKDDPFFKISEFSLEEGKILSNKEMDSLIYEK